MKLKYTILLAIVTWWIPILSGLILGFVTSLIERKYRTGLLNVLLSSAIASVFYIFLSIFVLKVPFLGNLLPTFSIIFSIADTIIAYLVFNFTFFRTSYSSVTNESMYTELYVSSREELEGKLRDLLVNCKDPQLTLSEDKITVHRECSGYTVDYEIVEVGKNKYKARVEVKKKDDYSDKF